MNRSAECYWGPEMIPYKFLREILRIRFANNLWESFNGPRGGFTLFSKCTLMLWGIGPVDRYCDKTIR